MHNKTLNRRELLVGAGSALLITEIPGAVAATAGNTAAIPPAPIARVEPVKDAYFGETLVDPYRWMENDKDHDWLPFLKGQNDHTRAVLDRIPGRGALLARIQQLSGDAVTTRSVQRAGGKLFFEQRPLGADNFKLFVRDGSQVRTLIDPTLLTQAGAGHISLDWWRASPDGSRLVYGLSKDGSEDSVAHVMTVGTGRDLPDQIPNTEGAHPSWLDDSSGFFYNQLTGAVGTPERYLDSVARFHRIGTDPATDPILMKRGLDPVVSYERIQGPLIHTFRGCSHVVLELSDVRPEMRRQGGRNRPALRWHAVGTVHDGPGGRCLVFIPGLARCGGLLVHHGLRRVEILRVDSEATHRYERLRVRTCLRDRQRRHPDPLLAGPQEGHQTRRQ